MSIGPKPQPIPKPLLKNRVAALMVHSDRYTLKGFSALARDAGISKQALSLFLLGKRRPSFDLVLRIVTALEAELGIPLDVRDVVTRGKFPTEFPCEAAGCPGCVPEAAWDAEGNIKPQFKGIAKGKWTEEMLIDLAE